jgi:hypothetical protein
MKYLNLLLVLPDDRVLLKRESYKWGTQSFIPWAATVEQYIENHINPLSIANVLLSNHFNINAPVDPNDKSLSIKQLEPVKTLSGREIIPVIAKSHTHISFQAKASENFKAMYFEKLLDSITEFSAFPKNGRYPIHTQTCVHTMRALFERRVFGK